MWCVYVHVCVQVYTLWRSEDNLGCWPSTFILSETVPCCTTTHARKSMSFWGLCLHFPSCCTNIRNKDTVCSIMWFLGIYTLVLKLMQEVLFLTELPFKSIFFVNGI